MLPWGIVWITMARKLTCTARCLGTSWSSTDILRFCFFALTGFFRPGLGNNNSHQLSPPELRHTHTHILRMLSGATGAGSMFSLHLRNAKCLYASTAASWETIVQDPWQDSLCFQALASLCHLKMTMLLALELAFVRTQRLFRGQLI